MSHAIAPALPGSTRSEQPDEPRLGPTPERVRQARAAGRDAVQEVVVDVDVKGVKTQAAVTRLLDGNVLDLLMSRGAITTEHYACGKEFYEHWQRSGLSSEGVIDPARPHVDGGSHKPQSDVALWHLSVWQAMVRALGQVHSAPLCACVLAGKTLDDYGQQRGPYRNAKQARDWAQTRLVAALEQLALNTRKIRRVPHPFAQPEEGA